MSFLERILRLIFGERASSSPGPQSAAPEPRRTNSATNMGVVARPRPSSRINLVKKASASLRPAADASLRDGIIVTDEFAYILEKLRNSRENLFITGKAGTGKSTLLRLFKAEARREPVLVAPTGVAALNIRGSTIHSFFKFPARALEPEDPRIKVDDRRQRLFRNLETLVIDEVSMVRADLLDGVDRFLRLNREDDRPFGGVRLILFGDPFQLPPVIKGRELRDYFQSVYGGPYFFNARSFAKGDFKCLELTRVFRQKDAELLRLLNAAREKKISPNDLRELNRRENARPDSGLGVVLCATNKLVQEINNRELDRLPGKARSYKAGVSGDFNPNDAPADETLILKEGAQVMMLKNDFDRRWVNGTLGTISKLGEGEISVRINGNDYDIARETWEIIDYEYDREKGRIQPKVTGQFTQYPAKLAWAITIHKSQGQTFDKVRIDLGDGAFAHGQTYVALSRCRTLEGITLAKKIRESDIRVDPLVLKFAASINRAAK